MYVCNCLGINEKQVQKEVGHGVETIEQLKDRTGLASCCGLCAKHAFMVMCDTRTTLECKNLEFSAQAS